MYYIQGQSTTSDCEGCSQGQYISIGETPEPEDIVEVNLTEISPTACGRADGQIVVTNPTSGYEYSLNGGTFQPSNVFENMEAGWYKVGVRPLGSNAFNCVSSTFAYLEEPPPPTLTFDSIHPSTCGARDGSIVLTGQGADDYVFRIRENGLRYDLPDNTYDELEGGKGYTFWVRPTNTTEPILCRTGVDLFIPQKDAPTIVADISEPTTCSTLGNGSISASGANTFIYFVEPGTDIYYFDTDYDNLENLAAGTYEFRGFPSAAATFQSGGFYAPPECYTDFVVQLDDPGIGIPSSFVQDPSACGVEDGQVTITANFGNPAYDYEYQVGNSPWQLSNVVENLSAGTYRSR
ncbi:MAG: hypothetical protein AAFY91_18080, partial [Bacteroidota bacterium]